MTHRGGVTSEDRLIFLAEATTIVPFSETTMRRAIAKGELEAWRANQNGKLVIWREALIAWATRQPASEHAENNKRRARRTARPSTPNRVQTADESRIPAPITLPQLL